MTICTNCNGEGIVGQGDKPWLQQGHKETCRACKGTGQVEDIAAGETVTGGSDAQASTPGTDGAVDNAPVPKEEGSPDGSGGNSAGQALG